MVVVTPVATPMPSRRNFSGGLRQESDVRPTEFLVEPHCCGHNHTAHVRSRGWDVRVLAGLRRDGSH